MGCGESRGAVSQMLPEASSVSSVFLSLPLTIFPNPAPDFSLLRRLSDEGDKREVRVFGERPSDPDAGPQSGKIHERFTVLCHRQQLLLLQLADPHSVMDPVQELCYLGIDTWVIGLCTATTPADHPYKVPRVATGTHQGSPAVSLACICPSIQVASTQHAVCKCPTVHA